MFGKVILLVAKELAPALKELFLAIRAGDSDRRKRALIRLENDAERLAAEKARGL